MPDRSLRLLMFPPQSARGGERGTVLLRERPSSPPDGKDPQGKDADPENSGRPGAGTDDNPFAPPPEGAPDRPWQPRRPSRGDASGEEGRDEGGDRSPWGRWSDRQPDRSPGGFGERPQLPGAGGEGPGRRPGPGTRWDPTDPAQRRARYALLCGMWAFFFVLFGWPYVALLLGALALYWGISSLRSAPRRPDPDQSAAPQPQGRPQATAAVSGLVTASLALVLVASGFAAQFVYRDYYACVDDALTHQARQSCDQHLPQQLRGLLDADG
ncbi:hypothetical protein [Streptomyces thermodiastaticus]|jgi:hypothetical protein|uniref:hypothetical protein n=1 Tax=Streptomyces thermodiastaticus TaxID=44061 RepID=UPI0016796EAE|nr:hypothetical protein [Streptomyces thermodiastaticus]MCE7550166.1 hypothetical protein [Streptomyces thermodiastaticus]GHF67895.1 hypothetical protein GCM10018787_15400 [Streptomyces thermodiastaticus]